MSKNQELFSINLEQTKRITELEKQLQFWKDKVSQLFETDILKCLDLKLNLNMQHVEESSNSHAQS